jgi:hypothetical protein
MFGCLPSVLMNESAEVIRLVNLVDLGEQEEGEDGGERA